MALIEKYMGKTISCFFFTVPGAVVGNKSIPLIGTGELIAGIKGHGISCPVGTPGPFGHDRLLGQFYNVFSVHILVAGHLVACDEGMPVISIPDIMVHFLGGIHVGD